MHAYTTAQKRSRVLFILKERSSGYPGSWSYSGCSTRYSSGLNNSVRFVVDMLIRAEIDAKAVHVVDNNCIDREVHRYKPTHVIIEAFWVVPEKFKILKKLHPNVKWIIRNHSKMEFLANEGIAFGWSLDYMREGLEVACNSPEAVVDWKKLARVAGIPETRVGYLPNYYPVFEESKWARWKYLHKLHKTKTIDIGCFGAIRPLKNHLNQALAAIEFASHLGVDLNFHINANRIEGNAEPVLNNLRKIFKELSYKRFKLVEHNWMEHDEFLKLVGTMDIVTQVSFSETFNIVGADAVATDVPVIGSYEIPWLPLNQVADPNSIKSIQNALHRTLAQEDQKPQMACLKHYSQLSADWWRETFDANSFYL